MDRPHPGPRRGAGPAREVHQGQRRLHVGDPARPGMRAVAISIDNRGATSAGGFILPNDRVDVIHTVRRPRKAEPTCNLGDHPGEYPRPGDRPEHPGAQRREGRHRRDARPSSSRRRRPKRSFSPRRSASSPSRCAASRTSMKPERRSARSAGCAPGDPLRRPAAGTRDNDPHRYPNRHRRLVALVAGALARRRRTRPSPTDCAAPTSGGPVLAIGSAGAGSRAPGRPLDRALAHRRSAARRQGGLRRQPEGRQRRRALDPQGLRDRHGQRRHVDLRDGCARGGRSRRSRSMSGATSTSSSQTLRTALPQAQIEVRPAGEFGAPHRQRRLRFGGAAGGRHRQRLRRAVGRRRRRQQGRRHQRASRSAARTR